MSVAGMVAAPVSSWPGHRQGAGETSKATGRPTARVEPGVGQLRKLGRRWGVRSCARRAWSRTAGRRRLRRSEADQNAAGDAGLGCSTLAALPARPAPVTGGAHLAEVR
jgi:hypothetical protein